MSDDGRVSRPPPRERTRDKEWVPFPGRKIRTPWIRTRLGRVVYNRRIHPFTVCDLARIVEKIAGNEPENRDFDDFRELFCVFRVFLGLGDLLATRVVTKIFGIFSLIGEEAQKVPGLLVQALLGLAKGLSKFFSALSGTSWGEEVLAAVSSQWPHPSQYIASALPSPTTLTTSEVENA